MAFKGTTGVTDVFSVSIPNERVSPLSWFTAEMGEISATLSIQTSFGKTPTGRKYNEDVMDKKI